MEIEIEIEIKKWKSKFWKSKSKSKIGNQKFKILEIEIEIKTGNRVLYGLSNLRAPIPATSFIRRPITNMVPPTVKENGKRVTTVEYSFNMFYCLKLTPFP